MRVRESIVHGVVFTEFVEEQLKVRFDLSVRLFFLILCQTIWMAIVAETWL